MPVSVGVVKYATQNLPTSIQQKEGNPNAFTLRQNYPNPFNPTTTISYSLNRRDKVRLSVYNLVGHEVAVLADGERSAGEHEILFDASRLASGVFFYRLQTSGSVRTRKLVFLK